MPYKPTGRPPGRPRKNPLPEPKPVRQVEPVKTHPPMGAIRVPAAGLEGTELKALGELCAECWPDGWPDMVTGLGCPHGTWARRLF